MYNILTRPRAVVLNYFLWATRGKRNTKLCKGKMDETLWQRREKKTFSSLWPFRPRSSRLRRLPLTLTLGFTVIPRKKNNNKNKIQAPSACTQIFFNPQFLLLGFGFPPNVYCESSINVQIRFPGWKCLNPLWIRKRVDAKSGIFYPLTSQDRAEFFTVNIKKYPETSARASVLGAS